MNTKVTFLKYLVALVFSLGIFTNAVHAEVENKEKVEASVQQVVDTINVNKADAGTLAKMLHGIGEKKAEAIIAFRELHGPFLTIDDMKQVKGLGEAFVAKNQSKIVFE